MEDLIKQAFLNVGIIGAQVQQGQYDLIGPPGIILPAVWEKVVQPDWAITMTMWPTQKPSSPVLPKMAPMPNQPNNKRPNVPMPPFPRGGGGGVPPPPWIPGSVRPPNIDIINAKPEPRHSKPSKHKSKNANVLSFLIGKPPKKK